MASAGAGRKWCRPWRNGRLRGPRRSPPFSPDRLCSRRRTLSEAPAEQPWRKKGRAVEAGGIRVCVAGGRRLHRLLACEEAPREGIHRARHPAKNRRREEGRAAAAARPRRGAGTAAAVRGRPLRRHHLRADHRRLPVRLPHRHAVPARFRQLQVQEQGRRGRSACDPSAMRGIQDGEVRNPHEYLLSVSHDQGTGNHRFVSDADEKVSRVFEAHLSFLKTLQEATLLIPDSSEYFDTVQVFGAKLTALGLSQKPIYTHGIKESPSSISNDCPDSIERIPDAVPTVFTEPPVEDQLAWNTLRPESHKLSAHGSELFSLCCDHARKLIASS